MRDARVETTRRAIVRDDAPGVATPAEKRDADAKSRRPLGVPKKKLEVPILPGYHVHVMNDIPGRIQAALEGGYVFVTPQEAPGFGSGDVVPGNSDLGNRVSRVVGKTADNLPLRAYLMKIKQEWYDRDQDAKARVMDKTDEAIRGGQINRKPGDKRYVSNINIE